MNGWSYDYMLALDNENCKLRGDARTANADAYAKIAIDAAGPKMNGFFGKNGGAEISCNYINWAYTESIDLTPKF